MIIHRATKQDIADLAQYSENFEVDPLKIKIRRRDQSLSNELKLLGFDQDGIRNLDGE